MRVPRVIQASLLVFALFLASPAWAQISIVVSSQPIPYCAASKDELMGTVTLRTGNSGTAPVNSVLQVSLPAALVTTTGSPSLQMTPNVPTATFTFSGQVMTIQFTAPTALASSTQFQISGIRIDVSKVVGNKVEASVDALPANAFTVNPFSTIIGNADPSTCPVTLQLSRTSVTFRAPAGPIIQPEQVVVSSTTGQSFAAPTSGVTTDTGGNWLSAVLRDSTSSSHTYDIFVTTTGMAVGKYTGKVTFTLAGATNSPLELNVTLVVFDGPIIVSNGDMVFRSSVGIDPAPQLLYVRVSDPKVPFPTVTIQVITPGGTNWLTATSVAGKDPNGLDALVVTVAPKAAGLAASGTASYLGKITLTSELSQPATQDVNIRFQVDATGPQIGLNQTKLTFTVPANSTTFQTAPVVVSNSGGGTLSWNGKATTDKGGNWLSLNPTSATSISGLSTTVTVTVNPTGLAQGIYTGNIELTATNASNSPQRVAVTLTVGDVPAVADKGVKNGASFTDGSGAVAAGAIVSIFGTKFASKTDASPTVPLATTLSGVQVKVNGVAQPLFYVSPTQINFQLAPDITGASISIVVSRDGVEGLAVTVPLTPTAPGLFTVSSDGKGAGAILKADYSLVTANNAAPRGSAILLYGTGMGAVNPAVAAGQAASSNPLSLMTLTPKVTIGGVQAKILFAGLAPFFVGLYQINVEIPAGVTPGSAVPLVVSITPAGSTTEVKSNEVQVAISQ